MKYILALLGFVLCGQIATAQCINWNGFYAGLNAGGAWGEAHVKTRTSLEGGYFTSNEVAQINDIGHRHLHAQGFIGGVQAGYNFQGCCSRFVVGLETDFSGTTLKKSYSKLVTDLDFDPSFLAVKQNIRARWLYTLRARIGYSYNCLFPFITGGLAVANIKYRQLFFDNFNAVFAPAFADFSESVTKSRTHTGWTVGGGLEYAFGCRFSVCLTYLYARFNHIKSSATGVDPASGQAGTFHNSANLNINILRLGVNWRFSAFR